MGARGPKPQLHAVREREGNVQRRPIPDGVRLPPEAPDEPNWLETFPPVKVGKKPAKPPAGPARLPRDADDEMKMAHAQAKLSHLLVMLGYHADLRHYEELVQLRAEAVRCREVARKCWRWVLPPLDAQGILARVDEHQLWDLCVTVARLDQCERDISRRGLNIMGERGLVKNPSVTSANNYREKLRAHVLDFGLSPQARDRLNPREAGSGEEGDWD